MKRIISFITMTAAAAAIMAGMLTVNADEHISARAYALIDAQTGAVIRSEGGSLRLPMASTTKIMTTLLTLESGELDEEFEVDGDAVLTEGSSMGLSVGDIVTKRDLCYGMMLPSGNDAANAAAVKLAGDYSSFAEMMNARARRIGLNNTSFVTPSGLHDEKHFSTALDMAALTREAMKNSDFREICSTDFIKLECFGGRTFYLNNSNKLLSQYGNCIGVKTGFTDEAGRCLVSAAEKDGITLICVTLNAPDDWNDHKKLYRIGFSSVKAESLDGLCGSISINVAGGEEDFISASPERIPICTVVNGNMPDITTKMIMPDFLYAPIEKGKKAAYMEIYADGQLIDKVGLITDKPCAYRSTEIKKSIYTLIIDYLKQFFKE